MKTEVKWKTGVHHEKELDGGWMLSFFVFFSSFVAGIRVSQFLQIKDLSKQKKIVWKDRKKESWNVDMDEWKL